MPSSPLTPTQWHALRHKALSAARRLKPDDPDGAKDLVRRVLVELFGDGGVGWTEPDAKQVLRRVCRRMWNLAGRDTQRFDPLRAPVVIDDDAFKAPVSNWRPGFIPDPLQLLLEKEQRLQGEARYAKLEASVEGDALALILLDEDYERDEAKAEALRRGYSPGEINDARRRLQRHLTSIVAEEKKVTR
jgi:hypothetical protein